LRAYHSVVLRVAGEGRERTAGAGVERDAEVEIAERARAVDLELVRPVDGQHAAAERAAQVADVALVAEPWRADLGEARVVGGEVEQRGDGRVGLPVVVAEEALEVAGQLGEPVRREQ
jgi:hypothetical protein